MTTGEEHRPRFRQWKPLATDPPEGTGVLADGLCETGKGWGVGICKEAWELWEMAAWPSGVLHWTVSDQHFDRLDRCPISGMSHWPALDAV